MPLFHGGHTGSNPVPSTMSNLKIKSNLSSNWAIPTLILSWDGQEQKEVECYIEEEGSRFNFESKWDDKSLEILGIEL